MNFWNTTDKKKNETLPMIWSPRALTGSNKFKTNVFEHQREQFKINTLFRINSKRKNEDALSCNVSSEDYIRTNMNNLKIHHKLIKRVRKLVRFNDQWRGRMVSPKILSTKIRSISKRRVVNMHIKKRSTEEIHPSFLNRTLWKVKQRKWFSPSPPRTAFNNVNDFIKYYDQSLKKHIESIYKH